MYCGSSSGSNGLYTAAAREVGKVLAKEGLELVFGGGQVGLMGILADAAMEAGGRVTGVIPSFLNLKEIAHGDVTEMITVETMHERKRLIHEMTDGAMALPGGFGTLEELFEMLTWGQLGLHSKPVGILNVNGYFDPMLESLDRAVADGFLKTENREMLLVHDHIGTLLELMRNYRAPALPKWIR